MKDTVETGRLTKFDSFRLNRDHVMDFKTSFKIHTNVFNFEAASPKTIQTVKNIIHFSDNSPLHKL